MQPQVIHSAVKSFSPFLKKGYFWPGAQPALHFGEAFFMNFHSITSSCLFRRGTAFSQTVTDMFFSQHFRKWELISLNQAVTGGAKRSQHWKCFRPLEKCVGHSLKFEPLPENSSPSLVFQAGYGHTFNQDADRTIRTE